MNDNQEIDNTLSINNSSSEEEGIDLFTLLKIVLDAKKKIIVTTLIFMIIGVFIAIFTPKKYTASTVIVPQTSGGSKVGGSLGGLAALAGVNLGGMSGGESGISPALYPQILSSIPFQKELLKTPLTIKGVEGRVSYEKYYLELHKPGVLTTIKKYTIGLPGLLISSLKGEKESPLLEEDEDVTYKQSQIIKINSNERKTIGKLRNNIFLDVNDSDGYVSISSTMPEPIAAAELTLTTQELLQKYIIDFKVNKSKDQLAFIQERFLEKEIEFKTIQSKLASYKDRNQFSNSSRAQTRLIQYQAEYDLAFNVYSELAKQLETQQIQVKEFTPVFTILKPVSIPLLKSSPNRIKILIIWTVLGFILSIVLILGKHFFNEFKEIISKKLNAE